MKENIKQIPISSVIKPVQQLIEVLNYPHTIEPWKCLRLHVGTNNIYKIYNANYKEKYVVKVYNECSMIDHMFEHRIIEYLGKLNLHPSVIYSCSEYRIERFIEGSGINNLQLREHSKLLKMVELIASLHNNKELKQEMFPLIQDKRSFVQIVNESWLNTFRNLYPKITETLSKTRFKKFANSLSWLLGEDFQNMFRSLLPSDEELVLSHNDISPANMLCPKDDDKAKMYLIDYEYCGLNFRGYDLAVLIEDIKTDYEYKEYPHFSMDQEMALTDEEENELLSHYIKFNNKIITKENLNLEVIKLKQQITSLKAIFQLAGTLWGITTHDWDKEVFDETNCWRIEYAMQRWKIFRNYIHKDLEDDQI